jgi:DNA-binding beta-propeller fold protein YncE
VSDADGTVPPSCEGSVSNRDSHLGLARWARHLLRRPPPTVGVLLGLPERALRSAGRDGGGPGARDRPDSQPLSCGRKALRANWAASAGLAAAIICVALSGCARPGFTPPSALPTAPEPAVSPPVVGTPAGRILEVGYQPEGIVVDATTRTIVVAVRGPSPGLDLLDATSGHLRAAVRLDGAARHLDLAAPGGPVLVPNETDDRLDFVSLPAGNVKSSVSVGRQPHDAASLSTVAVVTDELANTVDFLRGARVSKVVAAPLQPGGVAAEDSAFVVVGVRARVLAAYRPDGSLLTQAACGVGPTHVASGPDGYFYVTDTLGDALLVFDLHGSHLREVGRIPVGSRPYGIASDPFTGSVYVTLTGSNQVVALRFSGAEVIARRIWQTGRQPNSLAFDRLANALVVTLTASDQVELIPLTGTW